MDSLASAALSSWALDAPVIATLGLVAIVYVRGWQRGRQLFRDERDLQRLAAFMGGLAAVFIATESPLDAFDHLLLSAHMAQHLLLMMVAPALILLGHPTLPLLRGLPRQFVKEGLAPFLTFRPLRRFMKWLVSPPIAWLAFGISTIAWHVPRFYELALGSTFWHGLQHASFFWTGILFWWPVIRPMPGRLKQPQWLAIPYLALADLLNTALSALLIFSGKLFYPTYQAVRLTSMSPSEDQALAGAIMWVPGSVIYLVPAMMIAMRLLSPRRERKPVLIARKRQVPKSLAAVHRSFLLPVLRRMAQVCMLFVALAVIADGFFGPQVAPLNMAGVLPWIHWRALSILALLVIGNVFCMACPFVLVRDMGRKIFPPKLRWPRQLRSKWLAGALLVVYLWAYEAFGLWDSAWLTAWVIVGYFLAALLVDGVFRGASFCKYVCPIGQFHFVSSLISPREVSVRNTRLCKTCQTYDCIHGNARTRGCELYLFQPKKAGNLDCTFCMDCVKACPHDNIALRPVIPAKTLISDPYRSSIGRLSKRTDLAALALLIVFGAFVNAAGMVAPVMMWEHRLHTRLGANMMPVVIGLFVTAGIVIVPALAIFLCATMNLTSRLSAKVSDVARRFAFALVPLGFSMWAAHLLYHFATGWSAPIAVFGRMFSKSGATFPMPFVPAWLTSSQILILDAGLLLTLYIGWRIALQYGSRMRESISIVAPWAALSCTLYVAGIWILFQPMQMRGMIH